MLGSMFGWSLEPPTDPDAGHDGYGDHQDPDITDPDASDNNTAEEAPVG
jgi:hypothetical protein